MSDELPEGIWFKAQRVIRTVFQVVVSSLAVWAVVSAAAPQVLEELAKVLPGSWIVWLTGVIAGITVVAGVLTRIMAIPAVNKFLIQIGLGTVPRSATKL